MVIIEAGTVCKKIYGREAGRYCIVLSVEGHFANIAGVRKYGMCKAKRCNLKHLVPTKLKIALKSDKVADAEKAIYESGIISRMSLKKDKRKKYTQIINGKKKVEKPAKRAPAKKEKESKLEKKAEERPTKSKKEAKPKKEKASPEKK
ncbi:MAG: hypothetical protein JW727_00065 [Candidatus Aenigmarchaeota archaeon]|nr:hypothetical protein [Candidatus Aenigmarchaeota archaeon]